MHQNSAAGNAGADALQRPLIDFADRPKRPAMLHFRNHTYLCYTQKVPAGYLLDTARNTTSPLQIDDDARSRVANRRSRIADHGSSVADRRSQLQIHGGFFPCEKSAGIGKQIVVTEMRTDALLRRPRFLINSVPL